MTDYTTKYAAPPPEKDKNVVGKMVFVGVVLMVMACYVFYHFFFVVNIRYPLRAPKVKVGDWFLFAMDNRRMRETAMTIEKGWLDTKIEFLVELLDDNGGVIDSRLMTHLQSREQKNIDDMHKLVVNRPELILQLGLENEEKTVTVGGKPVKVTILRTREPEQETWFSDELSINGKVAVKENGVFVMEPLDFGSAAGAD